MGINTHGDVLGDSFVWAGVERIGTGDAQGVFRTRIVQGIPDNPTISNHIALGDTGLITNGRIPRRAAEVGRTTAATCSSKAT